MHLNYVFIHRIKLMDDATLYWSCGDYVVITDYTITQKIIFESYVVL